MDFFLSQEPESEESVSRDFLFFQGVYTRMWKECGCPPAIDVLETLVEALGNEEEPALKKELESLLVFMRVEMAEGTPINWFTKSIPGTPGARYETQARAVLHGIEKQKNISEEARQFFRNCLASLLEQINE